jgi:hypothetical protein
MQNRGKTAFVRMNINMMPSSYERARRAAKHQKMTLSSYIRMLIDNFSDKNAGRGGESASNLIKKADNLFVAAREYVLARSKEAAGFEEGEIESD